MFDTIMNRPLLSLCIPTYNRATFLDSSLQRIKSQVGEFVVKCNWELIVSDNCSTDTTREVVQKYVNEGMLINYMRNSSNIGGDRNFVQCFKRATGKYIWLLGDDDYLKRGTLDKILQLLSGGDYGLVHLKMTGKDCQTSAKTYLNSKDFISDVSYWITFMSANIVNAQAISKVDFHKYIGTFFTQVPIYMTAALSAPRNLMVYDDSLDCAADGENNGGFNLFQVFVNNYLNIWKEFVRKGNLTVWRYEREKYRLMRYFLLGFIVRLLFKKEAGNFEYKNSWSILLKRYWYCPYFYAFIPLAYIKSKK